MAELVLYCFYLSLLLANIRFVLSDLDGRLSYSQVLGHCISWSRGIENIVKLFSLQIPRCSFPVRGIRGQTLGHQDSCQEGGRSWRLLVGLLEELLADGQEEQAAGCQEEGMTVCRWGLLTGWGGGKASAC